MLVKIQQVGSFLTIVYIDQECLLIYITLENKCTEIIGDIVKLYCPSIEWRGNVKGKFLFVKFSHFGLEIFQTFLFKYLQTTAGYTKGFSTIIFVARESKTA